MHGCLLFDTLKAQAWAAALTVSAMDMVNAMPTTPSACAAQITWGTPATWCPRRSIAPTPSRACPALQEPSKSDEVSMRPRAGPCAQ